MKRPCCVYFSWLRCSVMRFTVGGLIVAGVAGARGATFSNATPINLPVGGPASPYPSPVAVSQVTGAVIRVSVTLNNLSHVFPDDVDVLLVGPGGQKVMLMSDAGGGNAVNNLNLTFAHGSGVTLPDSGQILSGTFEPTDFQVGGDVLPGPAPPGPYGTDLTVFNGVNPNGTWLLFVHDDATINGGGSAGGGWRLDLEVASAPVITAHPQSQTVAPGSTVSFSVTVTGTPPFGFQWLRNGQVLVPFGQGAPTLTITNAQAANAGTYAVLVTNSVNRTGVLSSNAELNVLGPLTLVESPRSQTASPGESVLFRVTAAGNPPLNYQWRLNGALLSGQTNPTLALNNVQAASGGHFSVTVWNDDGVFTTAPALLLVPDATGPEAADDFDDRPRLAGVSELQGVLQGNSSLATSERGEPLLPGGGKSVWYEWIAPSNGIVTLNLRGSGFDTLLGVFTGTTLSNLTLVTRDDDQGGFYTSALKFNARRGAAYQWVIDGLGFAGAGGEYTLNWKLEPTSVQIPVIVTHPEPLGVQQGSNATFFVVTESALDRFQWFFNDVPIPGAVSNVYTVLNVTPANVGFYSVLVSNQSGLILRSPSAPLQTGSGIDSFTFDKLEQINLRPTQGPISVGLGETGWNQFPSQANGGPGDPEPCLEPVFETLYQQVHAEDNGVIQVDTAGSQIFMLLAVYRGVPTGIENVDVLMACDVISGPANQTAVVQFNAIKDTNYTAVVAPLQGNGTETIKITATMGIAPPIPEMPDFCLIPPGGSILLTMPATNWVPVPNCQWRLNGQDISGGTNTSLLVTNFSLIHTGAYSVVMSNFAGVATNTVAYLDLAGPLVLGHTMTTNNGSVGFVIIASNAAPFLLVTKTNLDPSIPWSPLFTNQESCLTFFFTNANLLADPRRFFRAVPWP